MKEIIVDISNDGEIKIETRGFKVEKCITESQFLKDLLGQEIECHLTPAFYEVDKVIVKNFLTICG